VLDGNFATIMWTRELFAIFVWKIKKDTYALIYPQNGFVQYLQSFDNNKVLKEQIEFVNTCLSVQDHSLKFAWTYTRAHEFVKRS
jgi:hypothetical protein